MALKGFGQYVREGRERKGWTQVELAERLRTSTTTVSNIEREETMPNTDQVNALVVALGLSAEELLRKMGYVLTPPAAARLPRALVQALLEMSPEQWQGMLVLLGKTAGSSTPQAEKVP